VGSAFLFIEKARSTPNEKEKNLRLKIIYLIEHRFGEGYSWPSRRTTARTRTRVLLCSFKNEGTGGAQVIEPAPKGAPYRSLIPIGIALNHARHVNRPDMYVCK
jgi:hypothetical protein